MQVSGLVLGNVPGAPDERGKASFVVLPHFFSRNTKDFERKRFGCAVDVSHSDQKEKKRLGFVMYGGGLFSLSRCIQTNYPIVFSFVSVLFFFFFSLPPGLSNLQSSRFSAAMVTVFNLFATDEVGGKSGETSFLISVSVTGELGIKARTKKNTSRTVSKRPRPFLSTILWN